MHLKPGKTSRWRGKARLNSIQERTPYKEAGFIWVLRTTVALPDPEAAALAYPSG